LLFVGQTLLLFLLSLSLPLLLLFSFFLSLSFLIIGGCSLLGGGLSFGLGLSLGLSGCLGCGSGSSSIVSAAIAILFFALIFITSASEDLLDVRSSIDSSRGCLEHVLKPNVCFFCLLTSEHHAWLNVNLLSNNHFSEGDYFFQPSKLALLVFKAF
jgi:hypothetical protein